MSKFDWNDEKNELLEETRGICFEDILIHIKNGDVIDVIKHPQKERYLKQNIMVINIEGYVYLVPYVKSKGIRFMKTIIPSRKATRGYLL
jgi:uncharacterized DUF497 family protein